MDKLLFLKLLFVLIFCDFSAEHVHDSCEIEDLEYVLKRKLIIHIILQALLKLYCSTQVVEKLHYITTIIMI